MLMEQKEFHYYDIRIASNGDWYHEGSKINSGSFLGNEKTREWDVEPYLPVYTIDVASSNVYTERTIKKITRNK